MKIYVLIFYMKSEKNTKIYLRAFMDKKPRNTREVIKELFSVNGFSISTWRNPECTLRQCYKHTRRSFESVCDIVNTYFPNVSEKQIFKYLLTTKILDTKILRMSYCPQLLKTTVFYGGLQYEEDDGTSYSTNIAFFYPGRHWNRIIGISNILNKNNPNNCKSWEELLNSIGIYTYKDLVEFTKDKK